MPFKVIQLRTNWKPICDLLLVINSNWLGIETWVLKNTGPGETWPFCQTWNPGLRAAETRVSGLCFFGCLKLLSVHFYSRSCNSSMRFSLVVVHKLSKCLFLLFLQQTDYRPDPCVLFMVTGVTGPHGRLVIGWLQCTDVNDPWRLSWCSSVLSSVSWLVNNCSLLLQFSWCILYV